ISALVTLDIKRRYIDHDIRQRYTNHHDTQCISEGQTEFLLLERDPEFFADRSLEFNADQLQTRFKRVTRANRSSQEIHRFGKLFFELVKSPLANCGSNHGRDGTGAKGGRKAFV